MLVLAGDIHIGKLLVPFIERVSNALPYTHVVVIAGNHEFYRQYRLATLKAYREAFVKHPRIHFLENDYVDIDGDAFYRSYVVDRDFPLHSTQYTSEEVMNYAQDNVSDFSLIAEDSGDKVVAFSPEMAKILLMNQRQNHAAIGRVRHEEMYCRYSLSSSKKLRHPNFALDKVTSYFTADCEDIVKPSASLLVLWPQSLVINNPHRQHDIGEQSVWLSQ